MKLLKKVRWGRVWFALSTLAIGLLVMQNVEQRRELEQLQAQQGIIIPHLVLGENFNP